MAQFMYCLHYSQIWATLSSTFKRPWFQCVLLLQAWRLMPKSLGLPLLWFKTTFWFLLVNWVYWCLCVSSQGKNEPCGVAWVCNGGGRHGHLLSCCSWSCFIVILLCLICGIMFCFSWNKRLILGRKQI